MSLRIERFINELMASNCYLLVDEESAHCICIDPASEKSEREIEYININRLTLDYVILTHEHTDHTWGCNALVDAYPTAQVVCSKACEKNLKKKNRAYFLLYYDNPDYHFTMCNVNVTTETLGWKLDWFDNHIVFVPSPGHSMGSICVIVNGILFSGDTILQTKPYIDKRLGSKELFDESVRRVHSMLSGETWVYPGHGDKFLLKEHKCF